MKAQPGGLARFRQSAKMAIVKLHATTDSCVCCGVPYFGFARYPFCDRCFSGRCRRCASRVRESILRPFNLIERPRGPQMPCGWGCGACLTEHQMRAHFRKCPKGPALSDAVRRVSADLLAGIERAKRSKASRGRPPGWRMPCGWLCGSKLTASQIRGHFTECLKRPRL